MTTRKLKKKIGERVHHDELNYIEEAFATLPDEEREFIKGYVAEAGM